MDEKNEQLQQEAARLTEKVKGDTAEPGAVEKPGLASRMLRGFGKWVLYAVAALLVIYVIKPAIYEHMDASAAAEMTEAEKQESMGLPLKISKPPQGKSTTLNREELRWMAMMDIKLEAMRPHINQYNNKAIDEFNAMINEYNARCGEFRYRRSDLQTVRNEMEKYQEQIKQKAREEVQAKGWDKAPEKSKK